MMIMNKLILVLSLFLFGNKILISQTLVAGDLAIIGVNEDAGPPSGQDHSFAIIALKTIPAGEIVYFSDQGWNTSDPTTPMGFWISNTEAHYSWTAPAGGLSCGSVLRFYETGSDVMNVEGGGVVSEILSGTSWNLSGGDQILLYQSSTGVRPAGTVPIFITAIHMDDNGNDPATGWSIAVSGGNASQVPPGLTDGDNCIALFSSPFTEQDNVKYTGTLTGAAATLRGLINTNIDVGGLWSTHNGTPFNISPSGFTTSVVCTPLPVELVEFTAQLKENKTLLKWETASEINNQGFDIEYSDDGNNWRKMGHQDGNGSTDVNNTYFFYDKNPKIGVNYYRLKQIDFDGKFEYSNIESIKIEELNSTYSIYPNPTHAKEVAVINPNEGTTMSIFDGNGKLLFFSKLKVGNQRVSLEEFPEGLYFVKFVNGGHVKMKRLIINF